MNAVKKMARQESGIALLTTLLLLVLMSSLLVGFVMLITSGQKLSGANDDYSRAFYGAEAGMEKMTADLGTLFDTNYSPSAAQINALAMAPPSIPGIQYTKYDGTSGYQLNYNTDAGGNPLAAIASIQSGAYQGMTAMSTQYTLRVTARTASNTEVKLQRTTQTVGIPMFQFGIFSDTDLSFFPGPVFNFGGRTHTNGNLFLASGNTLTLSDRVTAVKNVIRTNLSNGFPTPGQYGGIVDITTSPGTGAFRPLAVNEGSLVGTIGSALNPNWTTISLSAADYAGNLRNGLTGAKTLNLGIVLLGNGTTQAVDLIRRPVPNEGANITNLRYYAQASFKVLLSDNSLDIMSLPCIDTSTPPLDLSTLAMPVANWTGAAATLRTLMNTNNTAGYNTPPVPLAASGAVKGATTYNNADGYWLPTPNAAQFATASGLPIIKGFLKIEVQTSYGNPCGTWKDVTLEVLSYGYAGRNMNPLSGLALGTGYGTGEPLQGLPTAQLPASTCQDVHPNAIIRLERVRDNPSNWVGTSFNGKCGVTDNALPASQVYPANPADYWPNALFDTREGTLRDVSPSTTAGVGAIKYSQMVSFNGVMQYIELDAQNLARYLAGALPGSGHLSYDSVNAPNDYTVYISDRRGNYTPGTLINAWPPLSASQHETGEYGWEDFVNPASAAGCPNAAQDIGEDLDGLGATGFYIYGDDPTYIMASGTAYTALGMGQLGTYSLGAPGNLYGAATTNAITANPNCASPAPSPVWPMAYVIHANEARENPNPFFRRAVKIVDGSLLTPLGICPSAVPCGLAIATENPAYIFGDFNANAAGGGFNDPNVAVSVNADALTLLSKNFNDANSFAFPYAFNYPPVGGAPVRNAVTTFYRTAIMSGKGISFPQPGGTAQDFGTDGGLHNFLRYIENWGGQTLNYRGSVISMFYNRQATGTYKCCTTVYSPPTRGYNFDIEFLTPSLLPPRTPLFRDVNTTGFTQLLLPQQ
ncbi:MAG TPA: hypothetical protein VE077_15050 [Candidatus Methylomirabilis sp.]|nr:hypothetical protein [Candidatus Methylomirabilis sp.]